MKTSDLRKKGAADLKKLLAELKGELQEFRFGMSSGQKKNIRRARTLRADVARIKTLLGETK